MILFMKNVLFVTYFWPPSGKATVHWPLRMTQYLVDHGWNSSVLTVDRDTFSSEDTSLLADVDQSMQVVRARGVDPFGMYRKFLGKKSDDALVASEAISREIKGFRHRLAIWVRMNLFVPDSRIGWYWNAVRKGSRLLAERRFDAIVSIGPPHTGLLVGKSLSEKFGIPHIPVFIDPWVDIAYYRGFKRSWLTLILDQFLEKSVVKHASRVVFVTKTLMEDYGKKYQWSGDKSHVLYWGFDEGPFELVRRARIPKSSHEVFLHAGNMFDHQNPSRLWETLRRRATSRKNLKLVFIGTVGPRIRKAIEAAGLSPRTEFRGFLPYQEMVREVMRASFLLVCTTEKRHVSGKLFEYVRSGKPILAYGDDNEEVASILAQCGNGMLLPYESSGVEFFKNLKRFKPVPRSVRVFDRKHIAGELARILNDAAAG